MSRVKPCLRFPWYVLWVGFYRQCDREFVLCTQYRVKTEAALPPGSPRESWGPSTPFSHPVQLFSLVWPSATPWAVASCPWAPCPSPAHRACSCPLRGWCHPTISSSLVPYSCHFQSFPASGSFAMSQFFASGGQGIGASASASVLLMNIQDQYPLGWTGLISLLSKRLSRVFSNTTVQFISSVQASILQLSAIFIVQFSHPYLTSGKPIVLTRQTFVSKVMSLLFNMLSRLVIVFLPWSKHLLISWLQSPSAVILKPPPKKKKKSVSLFPLFPHLFTMK